MKKRLPENSFSLLSIVHKTALLVFATFIFNLSFAQQWGILGNENQVSSVASAYTSITVLDNVPYVVYVEGTSSGVGKVKRRNAATGVWEQVGGNLSSNISFTKIYSDKNNKLYVTYVDVANSSRLAVVTYNTATQAWEPLLSGNPYVSAGTVTYSISAFNSTARSGLAFDNGNVPYITYSERSSANYNPYVKRFVSGAWQTVGGAAVSTDTALSNNIAVDDNGVPYLVYIKQQTSTTASTGTIKTFRFNSDSTVWEDVSPVSPVAPGSASTGATTGARHTSIVMDSDYNPIVSYFNTSNSNRSTIIRYDKLTGTWSFIGTTGTRDAPYNTLIRDNGGNVYNAFTDLLVNGGSSPMARVFKLAYSTTFFSELKNSNLSRGVDSGSVSAVNIAVGNDTSKTYIVYTKTNSASVVTPVVQIFNLPVTTKAVTNITSTSAQTGGDVSSDGGPAITERGIVYGTAINPTTSNTKVMDASAGDGSFTTSLTGLVAATTYYARAYATSSAGTVYGNNVNFTTSSPDATSVVVQDNGSTVTLSNGIVKATITKSNASVTSLIYNGVEMITGGYNGGSLYWSWNMPNYQNPSGCTYTLTADPHNNNFDYAEIKLHMGWNSSASTAAMDVDVYYSLPRNASGIYASATLAHPAAYPALPGGEWRMAGYPNPTFDWLSVDSLRNRIMPSGSDMDNAVSVAGAPPEVYRLTTGVYKDKYECKYDYSADFGDINVWGWSSTSKNVGLWMTTPSKEYYPGGPKKRELMCHATPVLLNMFGGTHYGMGDETAVASGENWQKTYGPFLIYCNKVAAGTANANIALWNDAKTQAVTEQAAWPYSWYTNPAYVKESGRGTVTGKLVINDNGNPSPANTWVGLTIPQAGSTNAADFQHWSKNYQFWVKTDANGNFSIPDVLPGTYNLYAFGAGAIGQLTLANFAAVTAGNTTALGTVTWTPARTAATIWEIGTPDRTAMEYRHGTDWWTSNTYPNLHWGKFMDYGDEFPNDVNFNIGQSNIATDWNFVQPYDKNVQTTSPNWKVNFNLTTAPTAGSTASVYVALAENFSSALILNVNGVNVTSPTTGIVPGSSSNAMIRKGIHGAFSEVRFNFPASNLHAGSNQISFTLRITGGATSGEVMYDYVRLEAAGTNLPLPINISSIQAYKKQQDIQVEWTTQNEANISLYEVEKSTDGIRFLKQASVDAKGNNSSVNNYNWLDVNAINGNNFYRIKALSKNGEAEYTKVVKVNMAGGVSGMVAYPSPFTGNVINLQLNNIEKGKYRLILLNNLGQQIMQKDFEHNGGSSAQTLELNNVPHGTYQLQLTGNGNVFVQQLIKN